MGIYETESGYVVKETLSGLAVYEDADMETLVCELDGVNLNSFREDYDEDNDIDDDKLEAAIKDEVDVEDFLDYQAEYC